MTYDTPHNTGGTLVNRKLASTSATQWDKIPVLNQSQWMQCHGSSICDYKTRFIPQPVILHIYIHTLMWTQTNNQGVIKTPDIR